MITGFTGTFVIPWSQTELDGQRGAPVADLRTGATWNWTGEAVRVDGPRGILPLGPAMGATDIRARAAQNARKLLSGMNIPAGGVVPPEPDRPLFDQTFTVTNGRRTWDVALVGTHQGRKPLLMFYGEMPPRQTDLWVVRHTVDPRTVQVTTQAPNGVICFTPGTMILTPDGPRDVASLTEGSLVQTQDNGPQEILWIGQRRISGARMMAVPALVPVRMRAGALDRSVPDAGLLVSPDHRVVLRGARARALFNADEVLVTARDLVNDRTILRDGSLREVRYIHVLLAQHEIVFANGVPTESFHPASAALASMDDVEQDRLFDRLPDLRDAPDDFGPFARRMLGQGDVAILRSDAGASYRI